MALKRENDCFADEVAIDFPSVAHLVARVRRAFLADASGERAETLKSACRRTKPTEARWCR